MPFFVYIRYGDNWKTRVALIATVERSSIDWVNNNKDRDMFDKRP